ncbi:MAG TPA: hypothetical protein ENK05_00295 [Gammaproteobacteria bacterium]|nr:hypothetical protein [Gammaproteobacteria bacterium]
MKLSDKALRLIGLQLLRSRERKDRSHQPTDAIHSREKGASPLPLIAPLQELKQRIARAEARAPVLPFAPKAGEETD